MESLEDRVAMVTGGATGIGLPAVRRRAVEGATVLIASCDALAAGLELLSPLGN